ncbi:MAG: inositol monophosphatase family protein [Candidatus Saelkia tenebricola]|nr:inositol monophosphatase family protein [Candidatus Saelkia tenebricola]
MIDLHKILKITQKIAKKAGGFILSKLGKAGKLEFKGERNIVTEIDKKSEKIIKAYLKKHFPNFEFLGEEFGGDINSEYYWLVDPIDGTNNFSHSFPVFCTSIALMKDKEPLIGVIYDPTRDELFYSIKGEGAYLNRKKISVSKIDIISRSLLATGFYYEFKEQTDTNIEHFINFIHHAQGIRRCGAAALDLAYVASGRLDGFWELGLNPWDTAAGLLLVREAGGCLTKLDGDVYDPFHSDIAASNGIIHQKILEILSL